MRGWVGPSVVLAGLAGALSCGGESVIGEGEPDPFAGGGSFGGSFDGTGGGGGSFGGSGGSGGSFGGSGGSGASGGSGGGTGGGSAAGTGGAPLGPFPLPGGAGQAGSANPMPGGSGGSGLAGFGGYLCDVQVALTKSCARNGCHSALDRYGDIDLSSIPKVHELVDQRATHGDINCASPGEPYRECTPSELPATCVPARLLDSLNPEESWILKKLSGDTTCGGAMPYPPGNSATNGWNEDRRACLLDFFYKVAISPNGQQ